MKNKISKKLIIAVSIFAAFLLGFMVAPSETTQVVDESANQRCEIQVDKWKELKTLDDTIFVLAGESLMITSKAMVAYELEDFESINEYNKQLSENNEKVEELVAKRDKLLKELEY